MLEAVLAKIHQALNRIGLSSDTASSSGSLHAKVTDVKGSLGNTNDVASSTGTVNAKLADIRNNMLVGSVIKSIQRGTTSVASGATVDITISAVNTAKAFVNLPAINLPGSGSSGQGAVYLSLTSSTNLAAVNGSGWASTTFSWEVIEYA